MKHGHVQALFGSAVRLQRKQLGFSQTELAGRSGLHWTYISDVERGARNLSLQSIAVLAEALQVSIPDLFQPAGTDPKTPRRRN
jgi:transcriptional regulator with XRE-family HTH domain